MEKTYTVGVLSTIFHSFLLFSSFSNCYLSYHDIGEDDKSFGSKISSCEYSTMRLGSGFADIFNAPAGDEDWNERTHQDFIAKNLGFAPWIADGIANSGGMTLSNRNARELYRSSGWVSKNISETPYGILNHKWIYMFGDSTTRQIWASYAAPFQNKNFERNAKELTRHYCNKQSNRVLHKKDNHIDHGGWKGPCGVNEITCHVAGYGENGLLTFDWKHFPYEDYDEWLFGSNGPFMKGFSGEGNRRPDVLTLQLGLHSCWHAIPDGLYSLHLPGVNESMIEAHLADIPRLLAAVRQAIDSYAPTPENSAKAYTQKTSVIVVTSGSTGMGVQGLRTDNCILRFNRAVSEAAHANGFAVLDRGEIERRIMYKSVESSKPYLKNDMHLPQPVQNIISTCLLHLLSCMDRDYTPHSTVSSGHNGIGIPPPPAAGVGGGHINGHAYRGYKHRRRTPPANPLYSPQQ